MFELIKESDLDTVRHFYRALAGTEFCAWTDIYPGEPELQSDFSALHPDMERRTI